MANKKVIEDYLSKEKKPELLNCPFCGGHASFSTRMETPNSIRFAKIECDSCHAMVGVGQNEIAEIINDICVAKWNRRYKESEE